MTNRDLTWIVQEFFWVCKHKRSLENMNAKDTIWVARAVIILISVVWLTLGHPTSYCLSTDNNCKIHEHSGWRALYGGNIW